MNWEAIGAIGEIKGALTEDITLAHCSASNAVRKKSANPRGLAS